MFKTLKILLRRSFLETASRQIVENLLGLARADGRAFLSHASVTLLL